VHGRRLGRRERRREAGQAVFARSHLPLDRIQALRRVRAGETYLYMYCFFYVCIYSSMYNHIPNVARHLSLLKIECSRSGGSVEVIDCVICRYR